MPWGTAHRLSAESDRLGDNFFEARKTWLQGHDRASRDVCLAAAREYKAALAREIDHLSRMGPNPEATAALKRARVYERLLLRQLNRIQETDKLAA